MMYSVTGAPEPAIVVEPQNIAPVIVEEKVKQNPEDFADVESYVRYYFADTPELIDVAFCESTFRHNDTDGNILRGIENSDDVGVMQINEKYHLKTAQDLGINIYKIEGNLEYAKTLHEKMGLTPWKYSKPCWSKKPQTKHLALNK